MGFKISWVAFHGLNKSQALAKARLRDTGELDDAYDLHFSCAELPGDWVVLFANDFEYASPEKLEELSANCRVIGCQVHEGMMYVDTSAYENGRCIWRTYHDSDEGRFHVEVEGTPPSAFAAIRERLVQEQTENGGEEADVDFIFDVPIETAASECGFRHDRFSFDWGEIAFTKAVRA